MKSNSEQLKDLLLVDLGLTKEQARLVIKKHSLLSYGQMRDLRKDLTSPDIEATLSLQAVSALNELWEYNEYSLQGWNVLDMSNFFYGLYQGLDYETIMLDRVAQFEEWSQVGKDVTFESYTHSMIDHYLEFTEQVLERVDDFGPLIRFIKYQLQLVKAYLSTKGD